jgi:hypothetical protein
VACGNTVNFRTANDNSATSAVHSPGSNMYALPLHVSANFNQYCIINLGTKRVFSRCQIRRMIELKRGDVVREQGNSNHKIQRQLIMRAA